MATSGAAQSHGFEWRTLLCPTHNWPVPTAELRTTPQPRTLMECCELCGEPVGDGKPFTTNSAGQRAMHMACLGNQEGACMKPRPAGRIWEHLLKVVRS
jgi:hypothetical protein